MPRIIPSWLILLYNMNCEVVYIASSEEFQLMARHSIESLRRVSDLPIVFMTARPKEAKDLEDLKNLKILKIENNPYPIKRGTKNRGNSLVWETKVNHFHNRFLSAHRETTIFVDADTRFLSDPSEIVSDHYDVAACREMVFKKDKFDRVVHQAINTGFLILNKNKRTTRLIERQQLVFNKLKSGVKPHKGKGGSGESFPCNDQKAFNLALEMDCSIKIFILSNEWNVREPLLEIVKNPKMYHLPNLHKKNNPWEPFLVK